LTISEAPVHRAVKIRLLGDLLAARPGLGVVIWPALRSASIAICFPGMASRVKRAPTSARPRPVRDDHELDDDEDHEDDEAHDHVAADDDLPKAATTWPASRAGGSAG